MIPIHLKLSGFLSYREPADVDFTSFNLACISGSNGAGKSSLLDAITWALFGQARKRDESLINNYPGVKAAEVAFVFSYEGDTYRVIRTLPRGKTTMLEFQILDEGQLARSEAKGRTTNERSPSSIVNGQWKPLTERTLRETQARIEQILRLDYDTFVNAAFFLQGRADQFAQQSPGRRKEILGNILGLELWDAYKERAAERRKAIEHDLNAVDGRIQEIDVELSEEVARKVRLAELEAQLEKLATSRKVQEAALANVKQVRASLEKQRELVQKLADVLERSQTNLSGHQARLAEREAERSTYADLLRRAAEVESAYAGWQKARQELEKWDTISSQFHEQEKRRLPFLEEINTEKAKLEQEKETLAKQKEVIRNQSSVTNGLQAELEIAHAELIDAETQVTRRVEVETEFQTKKEQQAALHAENDGLKAEMDQLKVRINSLEATEGAVCPLCGQPLSPEHRQSTLDQLQAEGKQKGDQFRANKLKLAELAEQLTALDSQLSTLSSAETDRLARAAVVSQLTERLENLRRQASEWKTNGAKRLVEIMKLLEKETFAADARKKLAKVDRELAALGYDAAAHDAARRSEVEARSAETEYRALESARAAMKPFDSEITNLQSQISNQQSEILNQQSEYAVASEALTFAESQAPDIDSTERLLFDLQEQENQLNQEVGAARQKVTVLDNLRKRKSRLETERGDLALAIGRHKTLERAFGRDGVPALLIEQALPEIEIKANELLDRLSDGAMSVRFVTQAVYKDRNREDLRETLDIRISDGAGVRDYEMFSGGEAFRINFAIRLALSEVLARRKGARLQTLVIDEGFGSQDAQGRQRLIEAINAVRGDFAKILVITHLDELKDAFPTRIEVEKTETGSMVRVI